VKILIINRFFIPGYNGGGPINSILNLLNLFKNNRFYNFFLFTSNSDLGSTIPYDVETNSCFNMDHYKILYSSNNIFILIKNYYKVKNLDNYDCIYINSFFSFKYAILPLFIFRRSKIILAPRGELMKGALYLKKIKKSLYLFFFYYILKFKIFNIYKFHFTSHDELSDFYLLSYNYSNYILLENISDISDLNNYKQKEIININILKFVFISRLSPKKNLHTLIEILSKFNKDNWILNIYGAFEDDNYKNYIFSLVQKYNLINKIFFNNSVSNFEVLNYFYLNDLFIFPTLGENFGFVIQESLLSNTKVVTSHYTPWDSLEKFNLGWNVDFNDKNSVLHLLNIIYNDRNILSFSSTNLNNYYSYKFRKDFLTEYKNLFYVS
jgi:glycosyltransferase involved in cell wall biosynthesis